MIKWNESKNERNENWENRRNRVCLCVCVENDQVRKTFPFPFLDLFLRFLVFLFGKFFSHCWCFSYDYPILSIWNNFFSFRFIMMMIISIDDDSKWKISLCIFIRFFFPSSSSTDHTHHTTVVHILKIWKFSIAMLLKLRMITSHSQYPLLLFDSQM